MKQAKPLAEILRPNSLEDIIGQQHLVGSNGVLRKLVDQGQLPSMILWGPPGVGKTTLSMILAQQANQQWFTLSAVNAGVKEVRQVITTAEKLDGAVLFIDEIHRFSKSQQDSLLHAVEKGDITLIGATTENPSFEVIRPLMSRCQLYVLESLSQSALESVIEKGIDYFAAQGTTVEVQESDALLRLSGGDARRLLNLLELVVSQHTNGAVITNELVQQTVQFQGVHYDKNGEQHYDIVSAFIKSIRGSDPNAGLYWLARMTEGGEDPKFIARRLVILASEDIGNANPNALLLANATFQAVQTVGYPECKLTLAQCVTYLATSVKSNASYMGIKKAIELVKRTGDLPVPLPLRNAPTQLMKNMDYGSGYQYSHDYEGNFVQQQYLPDALEGQVIYKPGANPSEQKQRNTLQKQWNGKYDY